MPQKTNLNVTPYFDDFDSTKNFQEVLFRPGHAVQARELTTLQTILKNQMEKSNRHLFKEGAMIIPGQLSFQNLKVIKLCSFDKEVYLLKYIKYQEINKNIQVCIDTFIFNKIKIILFKFAKFCYFFN